MFGQETSHERTMCLKERFSNKTQNTNPIITWENYGQGPAFSIEEYIVLGAFYSTQPS